jgi:hypothetical protein
VLFLDPFTPGARFTAERAPVAHFDRKRAMPPVAIDHVAVAVIDPGRPGGDLILTSMRAEGFELAGSLREDCRRQSA